jgi:mono/diheme cytochrome c family protein
MKILRILGFIVLGLVVLGGALVSYMYISTTRRINATYEVPEVADIPLPTDAASLAEGQRLFLTVGCVGCHGANGGGTVMSAEPAIGYVASSNLTSGSGGTASQYTRSGDWVRAIRHGVSPDGKSLLFMPAQEFGNLTDADMSKIIAYVQSLEPVDSNFEPNNLGPIARAVFMTGEVDMVAAEVIDHETVGPWDVEVGSTVEYGEYLAVRCTACHGSALDGSLPPPPGGIQPANITPHETGIGGWTLEEFKTAIQTGTRPDGSSIDPSMPWPSYSQLTDTEVEAIYKYLQTIEPVASEK